MLLIIAALISFTLIILSFDYRKRKFFKVAKSFFIAGSLLLFLAGLVTWKAIFDECKNYLPPKDYEVFDSFCHNSFLSETVILILLLIILLGFYYNVKEKYNVVKKLVRVELLLIALFVLATKIFTIFTGG